MTSGKRDNDHMDSDFEQVAEAYRELPPDEPPASIDHAILNRARRAGNDKSERPWNFGWIHALTTTAIVVLGVALILQMPEREPVAPLRVAKPPSGKLRDPASEFEPLRLPPPENANLPAPTLQRVIPGPTGPEAPLEERTETDRVSAGEQRSLARESLADQPAQSAAAGAAQGEQTGADEMDRKAETADPAQWLERILALKQAGDTSAWQEELDAFRAAWPDYPLPPELTD